ncbi:MAG: hypothetical protein HY704_16690 [Gemmatimonadetes bacterium]|nr:hypothetical protein [Gemmatimonadota bacterium]
MRKNCTRKAKGQRASASQLKLALGKLIRETLYETVVISGLAYVMEVLEAERAQVCGPRYRHAQERSAYRSGHVRSSLVLGGRRVSVNRPRVRRTVGEEVVLPSWAEWAVEDPLEERAIEQMRVGVSTRK